MSAPRPYFSCPRRGPAPPAGRLRPLGVFLGLLFSVFALVSAGGPHARALAVSNTYQVTALADDGAGSLRAAINSANGNSGSTITFKPGLTGTIRLASSLPALAADMTITGPGAAVIAVDGQGAARPFSVAYGTVRLSGLTIQNGYSDNGGGAYNSNGTLTLTACTLAGNSVGGNRAASGGGIYNEQGAVLTLTACTFVGNSASGNVAGGGCLLNAGAATLNSCTLSGNSAGVGGGIENRSSGTMTLAGCALTGNSGKYGGGGVYNSGTATLTGCALTGDSASDDFIYGAGYGRGGGVFNQGALTLTDDILYGDSALNGGEVDGFGSVTASHCDIGQAGYAGSGGNLSADPRLAALGSYGGPARTFALLPGSPCLGAGTDAGLAADQRGVAVPQNGRYDIGAFESRGFTVTVSGGDGQSATVGKAFALSLTATVTANDPAHLEPVAGGVVVFTPPASGASAALVGSPAFIGSGDAASATATANAVAGSYSVLADTGAGSASYGLTNTAAKAVTSVALTSSLNPSLAGQAVTFKATVNGGISPGGTVTFTIDGAAGSPVALGGGAATYAASGLSAGSHTVTAAYGGDSSSAASTSGALTQTVNPVAADVSGSVTVTQGSYGRVPRTTTIVQQVTLTNTSTTTLTGPLSLALDGLTPGVTLANAAGTTTGASGGAAGSPYLNIAGDLAPGASASVSVRYSDPKLALIQYKARVLAGPGSR